MILYSDVSVSNEEMGEERKEQQVFKLSNNSRRCGSSKFEKNWEARYPQRILLL